MKFRLSFIIALLISLGMAAQETDTAALSRRLEKHVEFLSSDSLEGRGIGTEGTVMARTYIADQFRGIGLQYLNDTTYLQAFEFMSGQARVRAVNIIGWIKGSDPDLQSEYILIGAHYDHLGFRNQNGEMEIYHGADDNASGVAGMIEIARYFAANPTLAKRSIIFAAFDGEESGLRGSYHLVGDNEHLDISAVKTMFSLDMIGMYSANNGLILDGIGTLDGGEKMAETIADEKNITLKKTTPDIQMRTDTWPFGDKGVPSVHAFTGTKSPYHKVGDTYEKLDYHGMAMIVGYLEDLVGKISASGDVSPSGHFARWGKPNSIRFNAGLTAGLGASRIRYPDEYYNPKGIFSYNAGIFMQMHLGGRLTLQPELLYQGDGCKSEEGTLRRQSVIVPVNLQVAIVNQYKGLIQVYPFAGAYYLYTFDGRNGGEPIDYEDTFPRDEWGLNLGLGWDIFDWQVKFTWRRSLTDFSPEQGKKEFPTAWYLSVGFQLW